MWITQSKLSEHTVEVKFKRKIIRKISEKVKTV